MNLSQAYFGIGIASLVDENAKIDEHFAFVMKDIGR